MSDNHTAPPSQTVSLSASEWAVALAALWEAPLAAKLTNPVITKIQQQLAAKPKAIVAEEAPS